MTELEPREMKVAKYKVSEGNPWMTASPAVTVLGL